MLRIVLLGSASVGAFVIGRKTFLHLKPSESKSGNGSSPMEIVAKGASCLQSSIGPIEPQDLAIGLAAISKVTEMKPPEAVGKLADKEGSDPLFLLEAQHWRAHCEAIYAGEPAAWSLLTHLPENTIVAAQWAPDNNTLRPAYVVCVDAPFGAAVVAIRGTNDVTDILLSGSTSPEKFDDGEAHAGFVHAAEHLIKEIEPHLDTAMEALTCPNPRLILVGHSLGCAVGTIVGLKLRQRFPSLRCWGLGPPACLSLNIARRCSEFCINIFASHDLVPRFSLCTLERLRKRVLSFDWEEADKLAQGDEDWENIKKASSTLRQMGETSKGVTDNIKETGTKFMQVGDRVQQGKDAVCKALPFGGGQENGQKPEEGKLGQQENDEAGEGEEKQAQPFMLYPPGRLFAIHCDPPGCGKMPENNSNAPQQRQYGAFPTFEEAKGARWKMTEVDPDSLGEIVVSPWCISDHMPGAVNLGLDALQRLASPVVSTK